MSFPLSPEKIGDGQTVLSATGYLRSIGALPAEPAPESIILCHPSELVRPALRRWRGRQIDRFPADLAILRRTGGRVGLVTRFGVGAPATAVLLEHLAAWGVKQVVSLGLAGGLQPNHLSGTIVPVTQALRDEGTSYHYLSADLPARSSDQLTTTLQNALHSVQLNLIKGKSWTIDAPYRETRVEVDKHASAGVLTVEMEAAALFAVAQSLHLEAASLLVIGDRMREAGWQIGFDRDFVFKQLAQVLDTAISALNQGAK